MFKKFRKNEKGFTLAELLIVVAIIGVLVAISIPIFTSQLEKARDATDAANLRAAYAQVSADLLTNEDPTITSKTSEPVKITGKTAGFTGVDEIAGVSTKTDSTLSAAVSGQQITVTVDETSKAPKFAVKN
mgnify:FL=1